MFEIGTWINHFPYFGIFLLLILGGIGFPFPEDTTLLLSGFLLANETIKPLPAFLVVYSGLLITDFFLYSAGRKYGRRLVEHRRFQRILSPDQLLKLEEKFEKWGAYVVFFGRHIVGFRAQIFLAAGVMKMSAVKFLMVDAISALITIGLWGGVGYWGGNSVQVLKKDITRIGHVAIVVFMIVVVSGIFFGILKTKGNLNTIEFQRCGNGMEIEPNNKIDGKWNFISPLCLFSCHTDFRGGAQGAGFRNHLAQWPEGAPS